jgi:glycosyltransferase involved in cell wall biosynthesis
MHGRLDVKELHPVYARYRSIPLVSISDAQREPLPLMNWVETVYHGLPRDMLQFNPGPGKYLAFLGRISPEKRPDIAIEVARRVGIPFKLAAKVDVVDRYYFNAVIKPLLSPPDIEYIGEISDSEKSEFLGNALAFMFTIDWPEPFGLAMIEALACGTPVIARSCGSVPELIRPGATGFIVNTVDEMIAAVGKIVKLSRAECRTEFENRFTVEIMAESYEQIYCRLIEEEQRKCSGRMKESYHRAARSQAIGRDSESDLRNLEEVNRPQPGWQPASQPVESQPIIAQKNGVVRHT